MVLLPLLGVLYGFDTLFSMLFPVFSPLRRPKITFKSLLIILLTVLSLIYLWMLFPLQIYYRIQLIDRLIAIILILVVGITYIPTYVYIKWLTIRAKNKIKSMRGLTIIGITGSFGKTTTKEYIYQLLSKRFPVIKTEKNQNTEISLAKTILEKVKPHHTIFIVEMGAYTRNEIRNLCKMTPPDISVITGINEEHLDLFGSLENIMKAKYEILEGLKTSGIAVLNINNPYVRLLKQRLIKERADVKYFDYSVKSSGNNPSLDFKITEVRFSSISFQVSDGTTTIDNKIQMVGTHSIENLLAALTVGKVAGMTLQEMNQFIHTLTTVPHRMELKTGTHGSIIIDDTYNANPTGVYSGLSHLSKFEGRRIAIITPLIELGKTASNIHEKIGYNAAKMCDYVLYTNANYSDSFLTGFQKINSQPDAVRIGLTKENREWLKRLITPKSALYFSGREAQKIMNAFINSDL